uniref:Ubiquinol-cytochrome c chaperone domain-containing protein n=1 Tax=Acrobeloides nanus TaxID=290746 RepID=A0A914CDX9_9BILA
MLRLYFRKNYFHLFCNSIGVCSFSTKSEINRLAVNTQSAIEPLESTSQTIPEPKVKLKTSFDYVQDQLKSKSLEEYVKSTIQSAIPKWLQRILLKVFKKVHLKDTKPLTSEDADILDRAGLKLQYDCANNFPYLELIKAFGMPDHISSWYKLTLLHTWLVLLRLQVSLEAAAYFRLRHTLFRAMWNDIEKRVDQIKHELEIKGGVKKDLRKMSMLYYQAVYELDEGVLGDDTVLAAALWRNIYSCEEFDPIQLNALVRYVRATIFWLDTLDANTIIIDGIKWKSPKELFEY